MSLNQIFDITDGQGLQMPTFDFARMPGLDLPVPQEAEIAANRARQIQRRATAAAIFQDTVGSVTRQSLTRAGERQVEGRFEQPQDLPERGQTQDLTGEFNQFLSSMGLTNA